MKPICCDIVKLTAGRSNIPQNVNEEFVFNNSPNTITMPNPIIAAMNSALRQKSRMFVPSSRAHL